MMGRVFLMSALALCIASFGGELRAQSYPTCFSVQNVPVTYIADSAVPDIAVARTAPNGQPVVLWNPQVTASLHPFTVEFFYYHECAHHALGHTLGAYGGGAERMADCWAKQTMWQVGVLTPQKYQVIRQELYTNSRPGMDWPNGAMRVQMLDGC